MFVSTLAGFTLLSAITEDEIVIALGTLNIAIIGMWTWAWLSKIRSLIQFLKHAQQNEAAREVPENQANSDPSTGEPQI